MKKRSHKSFRALLLEHWEAAIHIADELERAKPSVVEKFWHEVDEGLRRRKSTTESDVFDEGAWATIKGWPEGLYLSLYSKHSDWGRRKFVCEVTAECESPQAKKVVRALKNYPPIGGLKHYPPYHDAKDGTTYTGVYVVLGLSRDPDEWPVLGGRGAVVLAREVKKKAEHFVENVTPAIRKAMRKR